MAFDPADNSSFFFTTEEEEDYYDDDDMAYSTTAAERLKERFLTPVEVHDLRWPWYNIWNFGRGCPTPPWDKGIPSPPLVDIIVNRADHPFFLPHDNKPTPKTALVPRCGRGYDVLLLAKHGYHAVGVDSSKRAIADAKEYVEEEAQKLADAGKRLAGRVDLFVGDFFKDDWLQALGFDVVGGFDVIYDYAFLVTLQPEHRTEAAARMAQLLSPGDGLLIALEYPLSRPHEAGGPYHAITSETYDYLFGKKFQKLLHYSPEVTHKAGQGSDMVSVWRRNREGGPGIAVGEAAAEEIGESKEDEEDEVDDDDNNDDDDDDDDDGDDEEEEYEEEDEEEEEEEDIWSTGGEDVGFFGPLDEF